MLSYRNKMRRYYIGMNLSVFDTTMGHFPLSFCKLALEKNSPWVKDNT